MRLLTMAIVACASVVYIENLAAAELPDLVVTDVVVDADCGIVVSFRNQGSGPLPDTYPTPDISVQFIKGDSGFGGWGLSSTSIAAIRPPGGSVTQTFPQIIEGEVEIQTIVDSSNNILESNESNNTFTKQLECAPQFPDLAITGIRFTDDCATIVSLANLGDAPLPTDSYTPMGGGPNSWIERSFDGEVSEIAPPHTLFRVDPTRQLQPPGGTLDWTDTGSERASATVHYHWKASPFMSPKLREKFLNYANNEREIMVPASCLPDLVVSDLSLDEECHILATFRNAGTGPLPTAALRTTPPFVGTKVGIQFAIDDKGAGGRMLDLEEARLLETPGGTITIKSTSKVQAAPTGKNTLQVQKLPTTVSSEGTSTAQTSSAVPGAQQRPTRVLVETDRPNVRVTVDANTLVPEANESNNALAKELACDSRTLPTLTPSRPKANE